MPTIDYTGSAGVFKHLGALIARINSYEALGDTTLPDGPISGGSLATSSIIPAVFKAADQAITSLLIVAISTPGSPFLGRNPEDLELARGRIFVKAEGVAKGVPFDDMLRGANVRLVTGSGSSEQTAFAPHPKFSMHSFGCHFVEVTWQPEIARLRVSRVVTVMDAGRILNPLTGRNQIQGAVVMGIGMALQEETATDHRFGRFMTHNLADYHVPVNADVHAIDVIFVEEKDEEINPLGIKGVGEIGIVGTASAIANGATWWRSPGAAALTRQAQVAPVMDGKLDLYVGAARSREPRSAFAPCPHGF